MASRRSPEPTKRQRYWLDHLVACGQGGQRLSEYATAHGLDLSQLYNYKTLLKRRGLLPGGGPKPSVQRSRRSIRTHRTDPGGARAPIRFAAVHVSGDDSPRPALRVRLPNGIVVETAGAGAASVDRDLLSFLAGLLP